MYWLFRHVIVGPLLRLLFRIKVIGLENVPRTGGVILASNHQAVIDSFIIPLIVNRRVTFIAKSEYFTGKGVIGRLKKWFFSIGALPIDRSDRLAGKNAIELMKKIVAEGGTIGIHPEGTRAPDQHVYRGKTGVFDVAWATKAPIIPIALLGTKKANPPGKRWPRFFTRITVIIGEPFDVRSRVGGVPVPTLFAKAYQVSQLMRVIARLADWEYVDIDAQKVKNSRST